MEVTVTAYDGTVTTTFDAIGNNTDGADIADFDFEVDDVNEAPELVTTGLATNTHSNLTAKKISVDQQEDSVKKLYLNLTRLFEDEDEDNNTNDDDDDFTLSASVSNAPWLTIARHWNSDTESFTRSVVKWEDIKDGVDEKSSTNDDVTWDVGLTTAPRDDDYVLILEIDRTGMDGTGDNETPDPAEIAQDVDGLLTIRATDDDGASSTTKIPVKITDENVAPTGKVGDGVTIEDLTPTEKDTIKVKFNKSVDPDFTGAEKGTPVATIIQVTNVQTEGQTITETTVQASVGDSANYKVTQDDVGDTINGRAIYYELFEGSISKSPDTTAPENILLDGTSVVADRQDPAKIAITFSTTAVRTDDPDDANKDIVYDQLVAYLSPQTGWDPDGLHDTPGIEYEWEKSVNGRGGWSKFTAESDISIQNLVRVTLPETVEGMYVRLVVTFEDKNGVSERVESQSIKVGAIKTIGVDRSTDDNGNGNTTDPGEVTIPTISTGTGTTTNIPVGRTLRLDLSDVVPSGGSTKVEWIAGTKVVATSGFKAADTNKVADYTVTNDDRSNIIKVRLTNFDKDGAVTSIVSTDHIVTVRAPDNSDPIAPEATVTLDVGAAPAEEGDLESHSLTVPMASYFEDVEGGLTYGFAGPNDSTNQWTDQSIGGNTGDKDSLGVFLQNNTDTSNFGDQLLIIDGGTGMVNYYTTKSQTHDSDDDDGEGNWVTSVLTATDAAANNATATVNVQLRIDVAATGVKLGTTDATGSGTSYKVDGSVNEETKGAIVGIVDIQDQNLISHDYGAYTFTVDDDRFQVIASKTDASKATLKLKATKALDFEALEGPVDDKDDNDPSNDTKDVKVVVTATPKSGNFDPVKLTVTVAVINSDTEDDIPAPDYGSNMVPGLKDNETTSPDDDTTDDNTDDDDDAGTPAPAAMDALAGFFSVLDDGIF